MAARKPVWHEPLHETAVECEHPVGSTVWNNGVTYCADCGEHLS